MLMNKLISKLPTQKCRKYIQIGESSVLSRGCEFSITLATRSKSLKQDCECLF